MIVTRAPLRIPIGGGGTDFPSYYRDNGGFILSVAINKHVYVVLHDTIEDAVRLKYSKTEYQKDLDMLENRVAAEALKYFGIEKGVEVATFSDVPECSGLGGSSSFCVALVTAIREKLGLPLDKHKIFEEALDIERNKANQVGGIQDQFYAAYGGSWALTLNGDGVTMNPFDVSEFVPLLNLVYTNSYRTNFSIANRQDESTKRGDDSIVSNLDCVKALGLEIRDRIAEKDFDSVGQIFNDHWVLKKVRDPQVTNPVVDAAYSKAMEQGALGGKLIGIGGGGYVLLISKVELKGLDCIPIAVDSEGAKVIFKS